MRRALLLTCCLAVCAGVDPARAAIAIEAPPEALTGQSYKVVVRGTAPYEGRVYLRVQRDGACVEEYGDVELVSGAFRETFEVSEGQPGPALLCAWVIDHGQAGGPVTVDRASVAMPFRLARIDLSIAPVRRVVGTDQEVRARLRGVSESESSVWAWARPINGAPCSEVPWIGEQTYWGKVQGGVRLRVALPAITVPDTYRVCAQVMNETFGPATYTTIEAVVVVSQACTQARRSRTRSTASYRRARSVYRRARGVRRPAARRVLLRRKVALDRSRALVRDRC